MEIKELTRAEEQLMQILWQLKKGFVKDVIELLPEPKPASGRRSEPRSRWSQGLTIKKYLPHN